MSSSSRSTSARRSSSGPSNTGVLTPRRGPASGCSTSGKDRAPERLDKRGGQAGFTPAVPNVHASLHFVAGRNYVGASRPGGAISKSQPGRRSRVEGTVRFLLTLLSQVYLMELFDSRHRAPAAHEGGRARRLACMRQARFDLLAQDLLDVDLERRLQAAEAPCLCCFVRSPRFGKGEGIARARPRRVQRYAPDHAMVGVKAIRHVGVEREKHVGLRSSDLPHQLLAQLEAFNELGVRVP